MNTSIGPLQMASLKGNRGQHTQSHSELIANWPSAISNEYRCRRSFEAPAVNGPVARGRTLAAHARHTALGARRSLPLPGRAHYTFIS